MTKNCGNCKWWDMEHKEYHLIPANSYVADCCVPVPQWVNKNDMFYMAEVDGQDCPTWEERK